MRPSKWMLILLLLVVIAQYVSTRRSPGGSQGRGGYRPRPSYIVNPQNSRYGKQKQGYSGGRYSSRGRGTSYSSGFKPSARFASYTPARSTRYYGGTRPNYVSYGYSSWQAAAATGFIYGFHHYRTGYFRQHGNYGCSSSSSSGCRISCCDKLPQPPICTNTEEFHNETNKLGKFFCPLEKINTEAEKFCCGAESAQYCCTLEEVRYEEQMRQETEDRDKTGLYITVAVLGFVTLWVVCGCVCSCYYGGKCCQRESRRQSMVSQQLPVV